MRSRKISLAAACGLLIACGQSRNNQTSSDSGAAGTAGSSLGGANAGGAAAGAASAGNAGFGGSVRVIGGPTPCVTADGAPGILVDVFQLPEGPRPVCEALNQPGTLDPDCPSDVLIECSIEDCYEASTLEGCCRPDGYCGLFEAGYWGSAVALGCISRDPWIEHGEEVLRRPVVPVRCD